MEFSFAFIKLFTYSLSLLAPILIVLITVIVITGFYVSKKESWPVSDGLYWAFITATTVGYGDIRPTFNISKILAVFIAMTGMVFTGVIVALAIHAATIAFKEHADIAEIKTSIQKLR